MLCGCFSAERTGVLNSHEKRRVCGHIEETSEDISQEVEAWPSFLGTRWGYILPLLTVWVDFYLSPCLWMFPPSLTAAICSSRVFLSGPLFSGPFYSSAITLLLDCFDTESLITSGFIGISLHLTLHSDNNLDIALLPCWCYIHQGSEHHS